MSLVPSLAALPRVKIRRVRELPIAGEILCKVGESVTAETIIGRVLPQGELRILRIAEELGIGAAECAAKFRKQVGDVINRNELIIEIRGLFGLLVNRYLSPVDGRIEFISDVTGQVGVRLAAREISISAYVDGEIVDIEPSRSVTIESDGVYIQGAFGVGGERVGHVHLLPVENAESPGCGLLNEKLAGSVIIGGTNPSHDFLRKASDVGVVTYVCGGVTADVLRSYLGYDIGVAVTGEEAVSMSLIVTEGFGSLPLSPRIVELLRPHVGGRASTNGATQVRAGAIRPEIIVPHNQDLPIITPPQSLSIGSKVRIIRHPYFGALAEVIDLPPQPAKIPTGSEVRIAIVHLLPSGEQVAIPRANLELVD